ncbi:MAG TPA: double-strand break repair protein AddB [Alphaproteobacteria bacterium]|nr:double-strand break repair protein AddB [Alphaproteobacteria bacterium]
MPAPPHGLYTIPFSQNFLKKLAEGLLEFTSHDQKTLPTLRVLLPTRRAARGLRDAFFELGNGKPILLPRLQPIGDVDADELDLTLTGLGLDISDIPPAIDKLQRQFLLDDLIRKKEKNIPYEQSLSLANDLSMLIDQVHTEGLDFSNLPDLVPKEDWAKHWQDTLHFLEIVTAHWPAILESRGQVDPARRRALLMESLTSLWESHPPETPIIAAGSTGSIPTTARLLKTISELPQGAVLLPDLDLDMDEDSWDSLDETHPQKTMKNLLSFMKKKREDVKLWPVCDRKKQNPPRTRLARAAMLPAATFGAEKLGADEIADFNSGVKICEAANAREQAAVIATALRIMLEDKTKTACFVTPDRALARRVTTALKRWRIEADDSAGQSLSLTPSGILILTVLKLIEDDFAPIPLLETLKHPLSKFRDADLTEFETKILRGPRPAAGLEGLKKRLISLEIPIGPDVEKLFGEIETELSPLAILKTCIKPPAIFLKSLTSFLEKFAGGADQFWNNPESDSLSTFFSRVMVEFSHLPPMDFISWAGIMRELLTQETFREVQSRHPRIVILGQLESRLIHHDVMILGGLNEGMWPSEPAYDPWMSRPMREKFGLPPAARSIGLSAHDFVSAFSAPEVIITRAIKEEGAETVPSRWLQRLTTLLTAAGETPDWTKTDLLDWTRALDEPQNAFKEPAPPEPRPPRETRPQELSATWIEKWMNNPYHVYANKILRLKRIDSLDDESIFTDRGTLIHDIMEEFVKRTEMGLPDNARDLFMEIAHKKLSDLESLSPQWHYWWPRVERMADWVVTTERKWRNESIPWRQEIKGAYKIFESKDGKRSFTITAKADRIDRLKTGGAAIIDYKTGSPPPLWKIRKGLAPQLPVEALILEESGFDNRRMDTAALCYWKISTSSEEIRLHDKKSIPFADLVPQTREGLLNLITQFEDSTTPYISFPPTGTHIYEDERAYAHLARVAEWSSLGGEDDAETGDAA